ncbi:MAG: S8 family peptidase [Candidatus Omnitrophota bacterium]
MIPKRSSDKNLLYKHILSIALIVGFFFLSPSFLSAKYATHHSTRLRLEDADKKNYVANRVVVQFSSDAEESFNRMDWDVDRAPARLIRQSSAARRLSRRYRGEIKRVQFHPYTGFYILETSPDSDIEALCSQLRHESFIVSASPDYYAELCVTPNDPYYPYQYALHNTGQVFDLQTGISGKSGCDIHAPEGWDWTTGAIDHPVTIAVIDTGVSYSHEDLKNKIVPGYNFVEDSVNADDDHGHGTFVASLAAADSQNGVGVAGVCWNAKIMPLKCADQDGSASYLAIAAGIHYAVDNGAKIINISVGGKSPSPILETACEYAYNKNVLIVAAAGNNGAFVLFPASYDKYCLAVAATDADDQWAAFSNPGSQIDVAAPGVMVLGAAFSPTTPTVTNAYRYDSGTSFAAPLVSGAAALLLSYKPFLSAQQAMDLIKYTADDVNISLYPGVDNYLGYGRINLLTLLGAYEPE